MKNIYRILKSFRSSIKWKRRGRPETTTPVNHQDTTAVLLTPTCDNRFEEHQNDNRFLEHHNDNRFEEDHNDTQRRDLQDNRIDEDEVERDDLYEPLDHSKTSFRLLQVLPTRSQEGHVQCKLFEASIEDWRRDYTCLSYVWGPPNESTNEHIVVINGKKVHIAPNLYHFFQDASRRDFLQRRTNEHSGVDKKRQLYLQEPLWIDALCIDQNNIGERSHQVSQMGEIYSHSKQVIAWLGPCTLEGNPLEFLRFKSEPRRDQLLSTFFGSPPEEPESLSNDVNRRIVKPSEGSYSLLMDLAGRYWSRAWITQELAVARRVIMMLGTIDMDLEDLKVTREGMRMALVVLASISLPLYRVEETPIWQIYSLAVDKRWVDGQIPAKSGSNQTFEDSVSLLSLLTRFRDKKCLRGRDRIYSLRSISMERQDLKVDYTMPATSLLSHIVHISRQPLCFCSALSLIGALGADAQPEESEAWKSIYLQMELDCSEEPVPEDAPNWSRCTACVCAIADGPPTTRDLANTRIFCMSQICSGCLGHFRFTLSERSVQGIPSLYDSMPSPENKEAYFLPSIAGNSYTLFLSASYLLRVNADGGFEREFGCLIRADNKLRFVTLPERPNR